MTDTQAKALETLYKAAGQKFGVVVDINKAGLVIHRRTLGALLQRGFVARSTATGYSVTAAGAAKLAEERRIFSPLRRERGDGSMRNR